MEKTKFEMYEELINTTINTNAILKVLNQKNLITAAEFIEAKKEALNEFKEEFPEIFK